MLRTTVERQRRRSEPGRRRSASSSRRANDHRSPATASRGRLRRKRTACPLSSAIRLTSDIQRATLGADRIDIDRIKRVEHHPHRVGAAEHRRRRHRPGMRRSRAARRCRAGLRRGTCRWRRASTGGDGVSGGLRRVCRWRGRDGRCRLLQIVHAARAAPPRCRRCRRAARAARLRSSAAPDWALPTCGCSAASRRPACSAAACPVLTASDCACGRLGLRWLRLRLLGPGAAQTWTARIWTARIWTVRA